MSSNRTQRIYGDGTKSGRRRVLRPFSPRTLLRVEGLVVFATATAAYYTLDGPLWLFMVLALAPDVSMLGYLAGTSVGSAAYNAFHTYVVPLGLAALGFSLATPFVVWVALVWTAHVGADRAVGYGLKYPTEFADSHLSQMRDLNDSD